MKTTSVIQDRRPRFLAYVAVLFGLAWLAVAAAIRVDSSPLLSSDGFDVQAALLFASLCFLAEQFPIPMPSHRGSYSVSFVITIAAIVASGPAEATVATIAGTVNLKDAFKSPLSRHVFNASQLAITAGLGGIAYVLSAVRITDGPVSHRDLFPAVLVPLLAATAVNFLVNTALVSGAVALRDGTSISSIWSNQFRGLGRGYIAFALLGLLLGVLYVEVQWAAVVFLLMPLLVARHAFSASVNMQSAYDDTVRSLMTAIEAKDPYTRGHAERVSRLAEMTARAYGLPEDQCRVIRYAAMMHDVGKLTVLSKVLQKPGKLTPEEYDHMKIHPVRGIEILKDIDLLREALVGVRHHHERMDGNGYPDGLAGEDIPLYARLIMVSDAFDSMTSTRVYRRAKSIEEAFVELRRCEGTQFDSAALNALERAIERNGWEPVPEFDEEEGDVGAAAVV